MEGRDSKISPSIESHQWCDTNPAFVCITPLVWDRCGHLLFHRRVWYESGPQLYHGTRVIQIRPSIASHHRCDTNAGVNSIADQCDTKPGLEMNHLTRVIQSGPSISSHNWCDANTGVHVFADRCDTNRAFNCITPLVWYQSEQSSEVNFTGQLRDTIPAGLCHEAACKNETEQDTISTFFVSQHRLEKKETVAHTLLHFLHPLSVCTNISERHFPTQFCDTIPAGIVSRGRLETKTEEGIRILHMSYSCTVWWKRENVVD